MGLLEDAIREHLDLKRKHGAGEQELERQEAEALGPVRRGSPAPEPGDEAVPAEDALAPAGEEPLTGAEEALAPPAEAFEHDLHAAPPVEDEALAPPAEELEPDVDAALDAEEPHAVAPTEAPLLDEAPPAEAPRAPADEVEPDDAAYDDEPIDDARSTVDQPTELFDVEEALARETPPRGFPAQDEVSEPRAGDTPPRGFPAQDEAFEDEQLAEGDEEADVLEDTPDFLQDAPEHDRLWFEQKPPRDFDFD